MKETTLKTMMLHVHDQHGHKEHGSATFLLELNEVTNSYTMSMAICSKNDQFSRKEGRSIATTRMGLELDTIVGHYHPSYNLSTNIQIALRDYLWLAEKQPETSGSRLATMATEAFQSLIVKRW